MRTNVARSRDVQRLVGEASLRQINGIVGSR
jgi:hypothetical protein